jgi:hypothetical protein
VGPSGAGPLRRKSASCGEKEMAKPKVTVRFSNYSNIFKRLELIRSKGVLPKFKKVQLKYAFIGY